MVHRPGTLRHWKYSRVSSGARMCSCACSSVAAPLLMPPGAFVTGDGLTARIDEPTLQAIRLRCTAPYDAEAAAKVQPELRVSPHRRHR
uniref:Ald_Xan_dh_C2 domain-containing protein n=1 Tax=Panagrellus redivivus TaxID=6233 RepID=A0A7E4VXH0_PANRE